MRKNQDRDERTKRIAIIALILAFLACSFGFVTLTKNVDLDDGEDRVTFSVLKGGVLSINPHRPQNGKVYPTSTGGAKADPATLTENGIININVHFTAPGQSATYSFFGVNPTKETAFLNNITFGEKECKVSSNTTENYALKACDNIVMYISAQDESFKESVEELDFHALPAESNEPIAVTIKYLNKGQKADGNFSVDFGTSTLTYSDLD